LDTFAGDRKPGYVHGEGLGGTWYVVDVKGALARRAVATPSTTTTTPSARSGY
jgi:hypothetical protein